MRLAALVFLAVLFGSIPLIAVVSHKHAAPTPAKFFDVERPAHSLALYDKDGNVVAYCSTANGSLVGQCAIEDGYNLNDVMNAWLYAYEDR